MERFELAKSAIIRAGAALRQCSLDKTEVQRKTGHQDLVTCWDRKIEQMLRREILDAFPQDRVLGEEYPEEPGSLDAVVWYIDPIDGTTNFVNQRRSYAVSIGCWEGEQPLFGLVLDVERSSLYWAKKGSGAWRDSEAICVSQRREISDLLLTTPCIQYTFLEIHPHRERMLKLARDVRAVRSLGSVALELCQVAAGEADMFVTTRSAPWDHNGARVILQEAGGCICTLDGDTLPVNSKTTVAAFNSPEMQKLILQSKY